MSIDTSPVHQLGAAAVLPAHPRVTASPPALEQVVRLSGMAAFCYVFLPFALGHYLSLLLRNINAVLAPYLVGSMALSPGELGLLTSAFFFTYALAQLPIGLALDRYGPRKVQLTLMLVATFGALLFARGHSFAELVLARAIIGLGLAGCFMSAVKAVSHWVPPSRVPSVQGYLIAVGGLGSASATMPVRHMLEYTDWRGLFLLLAGLIACAGLLIWVVTPRASAGGASRSPTVKSVLDVYHDATFRKIISLLLVPHTVFFGIQGLWIGRWLSDVSHFPDAAVAYLLYLGMAAVIFGAIAVGLLTEWADRRGIAPLDMAAFGVAAFVLVQLALVLNYAPSRQLLSVLFTLVGTITGIEYALVARSMPRELTGRAATCLNLLIFVGAFLVQGCFGQFIGLWHPGPGGRIPPIAYQLGFLVLVLLQLPGLVRHFWRRSPVQCALVSHEPEECYEVGTVRPSR
jgi:predicted MFS family arabinose efflux permease